MKTKKDKQRSSYARYSSLVFQMLAIILIFTTIGYGIDSWQQTEDTWIIWLALIGVILAMYHTVRQIIQISNEQ